jgi:hypothetical protein
LVLEEVGGIVGIMRPMRPEDAVGKQIALYRRMTGVERLDIALGLHELSCELAREGIRRQYPEAAAVEVERRLHERIRLGTSLSDDRNGPAD